MSARELLHDVFTGNFTHARKRFVDWFSEDVAPELKGLVGRLTSDAGKVAEQVAREAWDNWQDGESFDVVLRKAVESAATKELTVLEQDIADWLGIIDRNPK